MCCTIKKIHPERRLVIVVMPPTDDTRFIINKILK